MFIQKLMKPKLIRITTIPISLTGLLTGQLRFMSEHFNILAVASPGEKFSIEMVEEKEGVRVYTVNMTRKITPLKDLSAVWHLYKLFKKEKPLIVHSHTPKAGTLSMIAAKLAGVPHRLHTIAGLPLVEARGAKRQLLNMVEKLTYACASKIYPNAHGLTEIILNHKFTKENKLKVIANGSSNGINTNYFHPEVVDPSAIHRLKKALGISSEDIVFVFAGRLVTDKGINELVSAFDRVDSEFKNVKLLLVGDYETELDPLLPKTLQIMTTNPNIINTGWVDDVRPYFAVSNCLVFPSYREGFPNVVMQAGAMQLPAIVSDINGCNEIIIEGKNGTIIPVKNAQVIYDKMSQFLKNELVFNPEACRDLITSRYERQIVWDALLDEYHSLIDQPMHKSRS